MLRDRWTKVQHHQPSLIWLFWLHQPDPPLRLYRFVDDCFAIIKKDTANELLHRVNALHPKIQFTIEREQNGKLPFLDLMISWTGDGKLTFEIYRKPTDSMLCIPACSYTPLSYKMAAFETMFHRLYSVPMSVENFNKEENYIYECAEINGYKREMIQKIQQKHSNKKKKAKTTLEREKKREPNEGRLMMLNFCPPVTEHVSKIGRKIGIPCVYRSQGSLGDLLINLKDKRHEHMKSGIYKIKCQDCEEEYIGQSRRRVEKRWKEHQAAFRLNQPQKSAVANHCLSQGHKIGEKSLVKEVTSVLELNAWESFFIANTSQSMNEGEAPIRSNLFLLNSQ
jgi:hypothetical protein